LGNLIDAQMRTPGRYGLLRAGQFLGIFHDVADAVMGAAATTLTSLPFLWRWRTGVFIHHIIDTFTVHELPGYLGHLMFKIVGLFGHTHVAQILCHP
jgi:hypothetical protein